MLLQAEAVGQCLHLNHMGHGAPSGTMIKERGVNSVSAYGWMKLPRSEGFTWPTTPYEVSQHTRRDQSRKERRQLRAAAAFLLCLCLVRASVSARVSVSVI